MRNHTRLASLLLLLASLLGAVTAEAADEVRRTFFKDADAALAAASPADVKLLSPRNYEQGMDAYQDAEKALARGRNIDYVGKKTAEAAEYFKAAVKAAKLARTVLSQVLKSRQDAETARAPDLSADLWEDAEDRFSSAVRYLERGDLNRAKKLDIEATSTYRDAELVAIKAQYLTETRNLIAQADKAKTKRYAPITLQKAKDLLAEAEQELSENRYDADRPRSLAKQANYEVKHAFYLASQVRRVNDDITVEQLILEWEAPLQEIASAADIVPTLSGGHDDLQQQLVGYIENMRNENQDLHQQVEGNESRLAQMETEMQALDNRLGGATQERMALMQRLEAQARIKEQFNKVEKMFTRSEARVFREHDDVILRLVGLTFDSGKSNIRPDVYNLLAKVKGAVALFPQSELVIEGHTDSYGSDAMNLRLSQSRAAAVRQYMSKTTGIPISRINAVGYGETRPVANNETAFGRAKNRRIDIVIKPNLDPSQYRDSYTLRE